MAPFGSSIAVATRELAARRAPGRTPALIPFPIRHLRQAAQGTRAGMFVSPQKLTVDKDRNLRLADDGGHQVFKLDQSDKVLLTLGKKGVAGLRLDEFDAPTELAIAPNGDIAI